MGEEKEAIKQTDHDMMFVVFSTLLTVTVRVTVQYCQSLSAGDITPQGAMCGEVGGVCFVTPDVNAINFSCILYHVPVIRVYMMCIQYIGLFLSIVIIPM